MDSGQDPCNREMDLLGEVEVHLMTCITIKSDAVKDVEFVDWNADCKE